jgi:hypothetical protein
MAKKIGLDRKSGQKSKILCYCQMEVTDATPNFDFLRIRHYVRLLRRDVSGILKARFSGTTIRSLRSGRVVHHSQAIPFSSAALRSLPILLREKDGVVKTFWH